jgi:prepilin-type N-terminal cleavage/methylation domain-containing protein
VTLRRQRGFSLIEIVIAVSLTAIVMVLVGSLFVSSLQAWRRGQDVREAQIQAGILVDVMARDVRNASQAPSVVIRPQLAVEEGEPLLAIAAPALAAGDAGSAWILFVHSPERQTVFRQVVIPQPGGRLALRESRVVATGVTRVTIEPVAGGVTIEAEVRKGRATAQARATATPRNP